MRVISFNYGGLRNPHAVLSLKALIRWRSPHVLFFIETKQPNKEMEVIRYKLELCYCLSIPTIRRARGLALLWRDDIQVHIQTYSLNHIDVHISLLTSIRAWRLTGIYGAPYDEQ